MKRIILILALACAGCGAEAIEVTNYLDSIDTDIRYAKQLRDAGALGASIDILGEAMQKILLRIAEIQSRSPCIVITNYVTVTQECTRAHCTNACLNCGTWKPNQWLGDGKIVTNDCNTAK